MMQKSLCLLLSLVVPILAQSNTTDINNDNSTIIPGDYSPPSNIEYVRNISIIVLVMIGSVLGLAILTYVLMGIADQFSYLWGGRHAGMLGGYDDGILSRKAHLYGLRLDERQRMLPQVLKVYKWSEYQQQQQQEAAVNQEAEETPPTDETSNETIDDAKSPTPSDNKATDEAPQCSICLNPFLDTAVVMTGTQCDHVFHQSCCMEWLYQHDHCPYCRREIVTAMEWHAAAVQVLGQERVEQMGLPHDSFPVTPAEEPAVVVGPEENNADDLEAGVSSNETEMAGEGDTAEEANQISSGENNDIEDVEQSIETEQEANGAPESDSLEDSTHCEPQGTLAEPLTEKE